MSDAEDLYVLVCDAVADFHRAHVLLRSLGQPPSRDIATVIEAAREASEALFLASRSAVATDDAKRRLVERLRGVAAHALVTVQREVAPGPE